MGGGGTLASLYRRTCLVYFVHIGTYTYVEFLHKPNARKFLQLKFQQLKNVKNYSEIERFIASQGESATGFPAG